MVNRTYQGNQNQTHHRQTHHLTNLIRRRIEITSNQLNKSNQRKKCRNHKKEDVPDSSSSDSDSFENRDYIRKRRKKESHRQTDPIKLCAYLMAKLLTTAYISKSSGSKWMRTRSRARFISSHL